MRKLYKIICTRGKDHFGLSLWAYSPEQAIKRAEKFVGYSGYRVAYRQ